ncbi:hypothetical protein C8R44DRAFT_984926 [Mycena epipterygia]|nr:hypothetical protein C8R44DRAFT_984926 [Mycena epipterygia]
MHRALKTLELVELICAQLDPEELGKYTSAASHADLSRLARTSTIFLHPALNVLWRHQGTIINLLRCMPSDLWEITETQISDEDGEPILMELKITLRRPVIFVDWQRFLFYSHRVKSFDINEDASLESLEVYDTLSLCFPEEYLFPNLQKLRYWLLDTADSFHHIGLFLTPGLTNLDITVENISHVPIFSTLAPKCTGLTHFSLGSPGLPIAAALPAISRFVCTLRHIESLVVARLDQAAISHISRLPGLRSLWLMCSDTPIPFSQIPPKFLHFPALTALKCETMEHAPALLETLRKCSLEEFTLISRGRSVPALKTTTQQFYSALATNCSHSSLQKLRIDGRFWNPSVNQLDIYSVEGEILKPVFSFGNLVKVSLSHPAGFDLDDIWVQDMACAWPLIESLLLSSDRSHRITSRVTLEGIYAFAKHCPRLQVLRMTFDATVVPKIKLNARKRVSQNSLDRLHVGYSLISKPRPIAKFLSAIFPHLNTIDTLCEDLPAHMADTLVGASALPAPNSHMVSVCRSAFLVAPPTDSLR